MNDDLFSISGRVDVSGSVLDLGGSISKSDCAKNVVEICIVVVHGGIYTLVMMAWLPCRFFSPLVCIVHAFISGTLSSFAFRPIS